MLLFAMMMLLQEGDGTIARETDQDWQLPFQEEERVGDASAVPS